MSLFSSIGKTLGRIAKVAAPVVGAVIGGPAGAVLSSGLVGGGSPSRAPAPRAAAAVPTTRAVPGGGIGGMSIPGMGSMNINQMLGAVGIGAGGPRMKTGKLTGNPIPYGMQEKMDPKTGQVYLGKVHRSRGLSSKDIRVARRVVRTMRTFDKQLSKKR